MAESKVSIPTPLVCRLLTNAAITVPNVSTVMATIHTQGARRLLMQIVVATAALTAFEIDARANPDAPYTPLYSTSADFTAPKGLLIGTSGDLTVQPVGNGWFIMDVMGLESVQIKATSGGTATMAVYGGAL